MKSIRTAQLGRSNLRNELKYLAGENSLFMRKCFILVAS
jgi:hypothetical protein